MRFPRLMSIALAVFLGAATAAIANERIMIVLDGSGSMWGQIDGVPKLQIARDTLRDVLKTVPETTELGLLAYGHRKKGDCGDIEMIVPPALGTASTIVNEADKMKFLGKTPLSAAVKQAAEELRYVEDAATVVLITDGLETCQANVCELGTLLEEQGANFTAHVVGFGLSKEEGAQVACLAENTGGKYFSADNGDALSKALQDTVVAVLPSITLVPVDQDGKKVTGIYLDWSVTNAETNSEEFADAGMGNGNGRAKPGKYLVSVNAPEASGGAEITVVEGKSEQSFEIPLEVVRLEATLTAPASTPAGAEFEVTWEGPDDEGDYITIVEVDAEKGAYKSYAYTADGNPAKITAPDGLGTYEVRYVHGHTENTLGKTTIEVGEIGASLSAPTAVAAGSKFDVEWQGPNYKDDFVTIVKKGAEEGTYLDYGYTNHGNPTTLTAPEEAGAYELRYVLGDSNRTLTSIAVRVGEIPASIIAPQSVVAGSPFTVEWSGPNNGDDYVTIAAVGTNDSAYLDYAYTKDANPATLNAPAEPGAYEIRYIAGGSVKTIAMQPITVEAATATVAASGDLIAGEMAQVTWDGPNNQLDYIAVAEVGAPNGSYLTYAYTEAGSPLSISLPEAPGQYELRYVLAVGDTTIARTNISVK